MEITTNIVILEDNHKLVEMLELSLQDKGWRNIKIFKNPFECVEYLKWLTTENKLFVLLLDKGLDGMDGITVIKEVRKFSTDSHITMMTGDPDAMTPIYAEKAGVNHFVRKPYEISELLYNLKSAAENLSKTELLNKIQESILIALSDNDDIIPKSVRKQLNGLLKDIWYNPNLALELKEALDRTLTIREPKKNDKKSKELKVDKKK